MTARRLCGSQIFLPKRCWSYHRVTVLTTSAVILVFSSSKSTRNGGTYRSTKSDEKKLHVERPGERGGRGWIARSFFYIFIIIWFFFSLARSYTSSVFYNSYWPKRIKMLILGAQLWPRTSKLLMQT